MQRPTLTPGAYQGLMRTAGSAGVFTILAFDQRDSLRKMLPETAATAHAKQLKERVVRAAGTEASAVLLDDEYGLGAALARDRSLGLILALEKSGYSGDSTYRRTELSPDWRVADIKKFGADAVKLLIYYHPHAGELTEAQEALARQVAAAAKKEDLAFFLEPVLYSLDAANPKDSEAFASQRAELVVESATRLSKTGAHVLKLEFPQDHKHSQDHDEWAGACAAVSRACAVPWALLSAGVDFPIFERQVEIACRNGASGFLGGRAIWKEATQLGGDELARFLGLTISERLRRLSAVAEAYGRPWREAYERAPL